MMLVALVIFASNTYAQDKDDIEVLASCKDGKVIAIVSTSNSKLTLTMVIDGNKQVTCSADTIVKIYESKFKIGDNGEGLIMYALVGIIGNHEFPGIGKASKSVVSAPFQEKIPELPKSSKPPKGQVIA